MKKVFTKFMGLMVILAIGSLMFFSGCKKPQGTFYLDNSTEYSMSITWDGYSMSVGAYGYNNYTVNAATDDAVVYANGYGYWGTEYGFNVPDGGSNTLYMYWGKKKDGTKCIMISKTKPVDWTQKSKK